MHKIYITFVLFIMVGVFQGCTFISATSEGNLTIDAHKNVEVVDPTSTVSMIPAL
jgi:hypothetical protein